MIKSKLFITVINKCYHFQIHWSTDLEAKIVFKSLQTSQIFHIYMFRRVGQTEQWLQKSV